jgi:hypothetical protein
MNQCDKFWTTEQVTNANKQATEYILKVKLQSDER